MDAPAFLATLWGDAPPGWIQLWEIATKRSAYVLGPASVGAQLDGAADIYTGVGLAPAPLGPHVRAKSHDVAAIAGLWLDIDIDNPGRKSDGVPSREAAIELAGAIAPPTLLVDSGYGLHAWHLFEGGPWRFESDQARTHAANMAWQWYALHRRYCQLWGWALGGTHDLARLLRLPGTTNGKLDPAVPVRCVSSDGPRHSRRDLSRACAVAGLPTVAPEAEALDVDFGDLPPWVADVLARYRGISAAFHHRPPNAKWSTSEWDLALASRSVPEGLANDQIGTLILAHRRAHGADESKLRRNGGKYLSDTIARARARSG